MASGKSLNVVQREGFFDDAFFKEAWEDFDRAMQQVLDKFDNRGLKVDVGSRTECQDVYSKIRSNKIEEDLYASQAIQITEQDGKFQVVMDVKNFNPRDLQVRAVDDRIVVEGAYQKVSEDGSSTSSKSFYKEFTLPDAADIDQVTTALSKDGVLSIKAPKKVGAAAVPEGPKKSNSSSSSSSTQQSSFAQSDNNSTSSFKSSSSKTVLQSTSGFETSSSDGLEGLPKDMRERLMFSDSGFGSTKTSTSSSPAPSEAGSECSRVSSTMEFDVGRKAPVRSEVSFNVASPSQPTPQTINPQQPSVQRPPQSMFQQPQQPTYQQSQQPMYQQPQQPMPQQYKQPVYQQPQQPVPQQSSQTIYQQPPQPMPQQPTQPLYQNPQQPIPQQPLHQQPMTQQPMSKQFPQQMPQTAPQAPRSEPVGIGSGNQSSVNITEENGRRVLTSQTSNVVKEKDGIMEHRETAAEITDKNSQAARREASTKITRQEEDPEGKFKRSEAADAAEVSESCVQHMPDGSVMSVKKSSSSTSSVKQSFSSSGGDVGGFFHTPDFPSGFGDLRNLMDRGHSLMSQMSTDSMASTLSGRSGFSDMSNFSHFSDASSKFSDMSNFSNLSNFSDMSSMSHQHASNMDNMFPERNSSRVMKSFSTSSSSSSSVHKSFSSNLRDGNL